MGKTRKYILRPYCISEYWRQQAVIKNTVLEFYRRNGIRNSKDILIHTSSIDRRQMQIPDKQFS